MLLSHLNQLEGALLARIDAGLPEGPAASDRGACRDVFVQHFVEPMFGGEWLISRGDIVDSQSRADSTCAGFDVLLCQPHAPRLVGAGGTAGHLVETVAAAITVLPVLDEAAMAAAVRAAHGVKALRRTALRRADDGPLLSDDDAPAAPASAAQAAVPCYVVAFDGPPQMEAAHVWLKQAYRDEGIVEPDLEPVGTLRSRVPSPALDGVFVLGRGFLNFDNVPFGFINDATRLTGAGICWAIATAGRGSLVSLYLQLGLAAIAMAGTRLDPRPYLADVQVDGLRFGN